jgi:hypothetical protein
VEEMTIPQPLVRGKKGLELIIGMGDMGPRRPPCGHPGDMPTCTRCSSASSTTPSVHRARLEVAVHVARLPGSAAGGGWPPAGVSACDTGINVHRPPGRVVPVLSG